MIQAYAYMVEADSSVPQLVLAWRGQLPDALQRLIKVLGLSSRISVRSDLSHHELTELYRSASVFLQTSYEEGLGMSVLEAMGCGLPVVATETAGTKETVVNQVTGWLIPQDAGVDVPRMVADRTLDVLRGDGSTLGARGRERCVTTFSTAVAIQRFTATYDQLLARGRTLPGHVHGAAGGRPKDMG
jgi:glycosyltransferase involved in cell wall biosynthesis